MSNGHSPPGLTDQQLNKQPLVDSGENLTGWMTKEAWLTWWGGGTLMKVTDVTFGLGLSGYLGTLQVGLRKGFWAVGRRLSRTRGRSGGHPGCEFGGHGHD